jgi:hypothetical protein
LPKEARVPPGLVGRDLELGVLLGCLEAAERGRANLVICVGEPGIGKSRLAEELAEKARERGVLTAWGRAAATDGAPPYWPWREVLRALEDAGTAGASAAADLAVPGVEPSLEERWRRFDAMVRTVLEAARSHPLLVVLDDLHGADEPSQVLVRPWRAPRARNGSCCSCAAAILTVRWQACPRSPMPPRSSCVAWSACRSASRSARLPGGPPATPSWPRCTTPRRAIRSSSPSSHAS